MIGFYKMYQSFENLNYMTIISKNTRKILLKCYESFMKCVYLSVIWKVDIPLVLQIFHCEWDYPHMSYRYLVV